MRIKKKNSATGVLDVWLRVKRIAVRTAVKERKSVKTASGEELDVDTAHHTRDAGKPSRRVASFGSLEMQLPVLPGQKGSAGAALTMNGSFSFAQGSLQAVVLLVDILFIFGIP